MGQPTLLHENLNGEEYSFAYEYDGYGNKTSTTYPNGFSVTNTYNTFGMLVEVHRTDNENMIWQLNSQDAMGRPYYTEQGNGIITEYQYDEHNFLTKIYSDVQDDQYSWDYHTGNLTARTDDRYQLTEEFEYDALDRLNRIVMDGRDDREISYQDNGNIGSKSFVGDYQYHSAKIHAVVGIDNENNDSEICHSTQNVHYTAFHKISQIAEENETGDSLVYLYGPDMERRKMFLFLNESSVMSRVYIGLYEKELDGYDEVTKEICYIAGGNGITAVYMNEQMYYLRRDHQGSITGLIDADGEIVEEYSYDAWGRRRNPETWNCNDAPIPQYLYRGYTFHEHMDEFGLINMNGRAYDPIVGRFLNPDPIIQNTTNTQNYNRYSYCLNNPLKYTDPSGYSYTNNERTRFKMRGINRRLENYLLKNGVNADLWISGELGAICNALGMGGNNGMSGIGTEMNGSAESFYVWKKSKTYQGFYCKETGVTIYPGLSVKGGLEKFVKDHFGEVSGLRDIAYDVNNNLGDAIGVTTYRGLFVSDVTITSIAQYDPKALFVIVGHEINHVMFNFSGLREYCKEFNIDFEPLSEKTAYNWSTTVKNSIGLAPEISAKIGDFEDFEYKRLHGNHYLLDPKYLATFKHYGLKIYSYE